MTLWDTRHTCHAWFVTLWQLNNCTKQCCWFTSISHACFWIDWWFFLTLTQRTTTVWSFLLLWCRVPPITKSTRKWCPLESWERDDPVYPEQKPFTWLQPSPAPGPSDMPSTHTLMPTTHTHNVCHHIRRLVRKYKPLNYIKSTASKVVIVCSADSVVSADIYGYWVCIRIFWSVDRTSGVDKYG